MMMERNTFINQDYKLFRVWNNNTAGKVFAFHEAVLGSVPDTLYGHSPWLRAIPMSRARSKP